LDDYRRITQLDAAGVTGRAISESSGCSRNTVSAALALAKSQGATFESVALLDSGPAATSVSALSPSLLAGHQPTNAPSAQQSPLTRLPGDANGEKLGFGWGNVSF